MSASQNTRWKLTQRPQQRRAPKRTPSTVDGLSWLLADLRGSNYHSVSLCVASLFLRALAFRGSHEELGSGLRIAAAAARLLVHEQALGRTHKTPQVWILFAEGQKGSSQKCKFAISR